MASSKAIKAVFCDMDGTLLNPTHRISDFTAETLKQLKQKGIKFIVCTGRPYPDVFATIRKCGLAPDYIITSNGARIHDGQLTLLTSHDMDPKIVEEIVRIDQTPTNEGKLETDDAKKAPKLFTTNVYNADLWLTDKAIPELIAAYDESYQCVDHGDKLKNLTRAELDHVHEAWFFGKPEDLVGLQKYMKATYGDTLRCSYSLPYLLDCVPVEVTKGNAVKEVCKLLQLSLEEVACFGDGMNDTPMLEIVGHPFLMSNAQPALKAAIPHGEIIGSNAEDGVAKKLRELFL